MNLTVNANEGMLVVERNKTEEQYPIGGICKFYRMNILDETQEEFCAETGIKQSNLSVFEKRDGGKYWYSVMNAFVNRGIIVWIENLDPAVSKFILSILYDQKMEREKRLFDKMIENGIFINAEDNMETITWE